MPSIEFLRSFRIGQLAIFDLTVSYLGIFLLAPILTKLVAKIGLNITTTQWLWLTLPLSILVHLIFGQQTALTKMFVDLNNYYLVKLIIFFMLFMGLRKVGN